MANTSIPDYLSQEDKPFHCHREENSLSFEWYAKVAFLFLGDGNKAEYEVGSEIFRKEVDILLYSSA